MPIYEYECSACGKHHEIMQRITESPLTHCPACGGKMRKLISNTSFVLKGTGWYVTDYSDRKKKDSRSDSGSSSSGDAAKTDTKSDSGSGVKKEAKKDPKKKAASGAK